MKNIEFLTVFLALNKKSKASKLKNDKLTFVLLNSQKIYVFCEFFVNVIFYSGLIKLKIFFKL
ncbi:hypothetical protein DMC01_02700 [Campylobacter troglodytis]|nr:hypothetical protein DMC01_02700 [Campylobacter troglodytis]